MTLRNGLRAAACLVLALGAGRMTADTHSTKAAPQPPVLTAPRPATHPSRVMSFRSLEAEIDTRVLANLLSDATAKLPNEIPLSVVSGQISRCEEDTCVVPLTVRVIGAEGPVRLTFAVANPKGELSDVHHAECGTGACTISLVLERGKNSISVGVMDGLASATGYTTLRVNANRVYARAGRTEWF